MAIQKSITDAYGVTHSDAYIMVGAINIILGESAEGLSGLTPGGAKNKTRIQIKVFHNATARSKSDVNAVKETLFIAWGEIVSDDSDAYFTDTVLKTADKSILSQAYAWVKTQTDLGGLNLTTGTTDV